MFNHSSVVRSFRYVVFAGWVAAGCGGAAKSTETHVARDEPVRTGNVDYDDYFEDVSALRATSRSAPDDDKKARAPAAQALGLTDASVDSVLAAFHGKADELANTKARIHFFFFGLDDQGKPVSGKRIQVVAVSGIKQPVTPDAQRIAAGMEQTSLAEAQLLDTYGIVPEKGHRLEAKAGELRKSIPTEFPQLSGDKKSQLEKELDAAQQLTGQIAQDGDKIMGAALRFLKEGSQIAVAAATTETKAAAPPPGARLTKSKTLGGGSNKAPADAARPAKPAPAAPAAPAAPRAPKPAPKKKAAPAPAAAPAEPAPKAPDFNP